MGEFIRIQGGQMAKVALIVWDESKDGSYTPTIIVRA